MRKVTIDLDALDSALMHLTGRSASTVIRGAIESLDETPEPSPPPTPSLDILRRFAKVAGWTEPSGAFNCREAKTFTRFESWATGDPTAEAAAAKWLDSEYALDAAAIVAVRRGGGMRTVCRLGMANEYEVSVFGKRLSEAFPAEAKSRSRAAVLACLAAFEEKPA